MRKIGDKSWKLLPWNQGGYGGYVYAVRSGEFVKIGVKLKEFHYRGEWFHLTHECEKKLVSFFKSKRLRQLALSARCNDAYLGRRVSVMQQIAASY